MQLSLCMASGFVTTPSETTVFGRSPGPRSLRFFHAELLKASECPKCPIGKSYAPGGVPRSGRQIAAAAAVRALSARFHDVAGRYGLAAPDYFLGLATTGRLGPDALAELISSRVREGTTEIMLHPGFCDEDLRTAGGHLLEQRELELQALLAASSREAAARSSIQLVTYRELAN